MKFIADGLRDSDLTTLIKSDIVVQLHGLQPFAKVAQLVEQRFEEARVGGAKPSLGTSQSDIMRYPFTELGQMMDLDRIDKMLRVLDQTRDVMHQAAFFIELIEDDPEKDLAWIEHRLRHLGCPLLYLIAIPLQHLPAGYRVFDPVNRFSPNFWIWNSVNGPEERAKTIDRFDLSNQPNLENLKVTGFLATG